MNQELLELSRLIKGLNRDTEISFNTNGKGVVRIRLIEKFDFNKSHQIKNRISEEFLDNIDGCKIFTVINGRGFYYVFRHNIYENKNSKLNKFLWKMLDEKDTLETFIDIFNGEKFLNSLFCYIESIKINEGISCSKKNPKRKNIGNFRKT